jgi:hypothetical protein
MDQLPSRLVDHSSYSSSMRSTTAPGGQPDRADACSTYAFKSFLDAGAMLSFGSDWPVAPLSR